MHSGTPEDFLLSPFVEILFKWHECFSHGLILLEGNIVFGSISAGKCTQVDIVRHFLGTNQNHLIVCKI